MMSPPYFEPKIIAPGPQPLEPDRVLLVDADVERRVRWGRILEDASYNVVGVADSTQALVEVETAQTAMIIAHIADPARDDFDLCRTLRRKPDTRAIPVIVVTSFGDPFTREQIVRAGGSGILVEPFNRSLLVRQVRRLIARAKTHVSTPRPTLKEGPVAEVPPAL